jgi:hypothetical protein
MTRLKELKRIEAAIEHKNNAELLWALEYCRMRLGIAPRVWARPLGVRSPV